MIVIGQITPLMCLDVWVSKYNSYSSTHGPISSENGGKMIEIISITKKYGRNGHGLVWLKTLSKSQLRLFYEEMSKV